MSTPNTFPPHYSPQKWLSDERTTIMRGPRTAGSAWEAEVWYRPSVGMWHASLPFDTSALFRTAAEAVAWIESRR